MATSGYSEDLQPQQANSVTLATPAATTPSSTKTTHFLSEIPLTSGTTATANHSSGVSKTGQDALCSQAPPTQAQSQKAVVVTTPTQQHYVSPNIQHSTVQKSNGPSGSPQYIIVTVTGEGHWHCVIHILQTHTGFHTFSSSYKPPEDMPHQAVWARFSMSCKCLIRYKHQAGSCWETDSLSGTVWIILVRNQWQRAVVFRYLYKNL